jgi:hypothetical protein
MELRPLGRTVTAAIIGPRTMEQIESQLPAAEVTLDAALLDRHRRHRPARRQPQPSRHELWRAGARPTVRERPLTEDRCRFPWRLLRAARPCPSRR